MDKEYLKYYLPFVVDGIKYRKSIDIPLAKPGGLQCWPCDDEYVLTIEGFKRIK